MCNIERLAQGLNVLLRDMPTDCLLLCNGKSGRNYISLFSKDIFADEFCRRFSNFSKTEAAQVYEMLQTTQSDINYGHHAGIFSLILITANNFFIPYEEHVRCKSSKFIDWHESVRELGQMPFICAWLANRDLCENNYRLKSSFSFPPSVKTDDYRLEQVLSEGIAENHYHLFGSAPAAHFSWISLMNHIIGRKSQFEDKKMSPPFFKNAAGLHKDVIRSAAVRAFFWRMIRADGEFSKPGSDELSELKNILKNPVAAQTQEQMINACLMGAGHRCSNERLDYAMPAAAYGDGAGIYGPFAGENYFLYMMFRAVLKGEPKFLKYADLFLFYLMISLRFRAEIIQCNNAVGFENFQDYQNRKYIFIDSQANKSMSAYEKSFLRMAVEAPLDNPALTTLEARIGPDKPLKKYVLEILEHRQKYLRHRCYNRHPCIYRSSEDNICQNEDKVCFRYHKQLLLVASIPKCSDELITDSPADRLKQMIKCRHEAYRKNKVAPAIADIRSLRRDTTPNNAAKFLYGIDACSMEIGCRPEVFAPAFRQARLDYTPSAPPLRITYHAGEDFLDLADGLRAIDEAMLFLELQNADRLGHALALGVDAADWYRSKEMQIILPRQDLLDNAVWLYMKTKEFGLPYDNRLMHELEQIFLEQFRLVWNISDPSFELRNSINISDYFNSWQLRGDEPEYYLHYKDSSFLKNERSSKPGELQSGIEAEQLRRKNRLARTLYRLYHYSPEIKKKGSEITTHIVSEQYVIGVTNLQTELQKRISQRGISIECNPSSNYLIGTFRCFQKHPIFRWNAFGLPALGDTPQLHVSVNTDDQGVFDTDLESEYSLLACALENMLDSEGRHLNKPAEIYRWIDNIRKMGLEQSFKMLEYELKEGYNYGR